MYPSEPFPHFVDDYLAYLYEVQPSQATLDGVHLHDDLLEDLSRSAIDAHVRALSGFGRRLHPDDARDHHSGLRDRQYALRASGVGYGRGSFSDFPPKAKRSVTVRRARRVSCPCP